MLNGLGGLAVMAVAVIFGSAHIIQVWLTGYPYETAVIGAAFFSVLVWMWKLRAERAMPSYINVALLSPQQYEQCCADLLELAGWNVSLVGSSGDQGVDVVAERRGYRAVVQCKNHRHHVGNAAVQQIVAGKAHYCAQIAVVVAPNGYTLAARALAKSNGVYLLNDEALPKLERIARIP